MICDVCGFNGTSGRYHCRACSRRYAPLGPITPALLDRAERAVDSAYDGDGVATFRGVAAAVLLALGYTATESES